MKITKAIIPAAGLGTRMLPLTKEIPKEMFPTYVRGINGNLCMRPILQSVFEQLHDNGFREFLFIVGRGKRSIEDHFTRDLDFTTHLRRNHKEDLAEEMENFYNKIKDSSIIFINQSEPKGFGDAVLRAKPFISEDILVHAGDTFIISEHKNHIRELLETHDRLNSVVTFMSQEVEDPTSFGIINKSESLGLGKLKVNLVEEKPANPVGNLAIMPIYIFKQEIFGALEELLPGVGGEIQLTDGIQNLIDNNFNVNSLKLENSDVRLDVGRPESAWEALKSSYEYASPSKNN